MHERVHAHGSGRETGLAEEPDESSTAAFPHQGHAEGPHHVAASQALARIAPARGLTRPLSGLRPAQEVLS